MRVATIVDVRLTIIVDEDILINGLCPIMVLANERLPDRIFVRALGLVCNSNTNTTNLRFSLLDIIGCEVQVVFSVTFNMGRRSHGSVCPRYLGFGKDVRMLSPVYQVGRRESIEIGLLVIGVG